MLNDNVFEHHSSGAEMWREYVQNYGIIHARVLCHKYLHMEARNADEGERFFCGQLRDGMAMGLNYRDSEVYMYSESWARIKGETALYDESMRINKICAEHIDEAIRAVEFGDGTHDFKFALAALADHYGFERLNLVLKCEVRDDLVHGNFPNELYQWARSIRKDNDYDGFDINAQPNVLVGLITELRNKEAEINMSHFPPKEAVERLREQYPVGTRIEITSINDPFNDTLKPGDKGTVDHIDDTGTIFAAWDNGSGLGLVYGVDSCKKLEPELNHGVTDVEQNSANKAQTYTLGDLIEKMEPQNRKDKAVMRDCIDGLGVYAAMVALDRYNTSKSAEISGLISDLVHYWGLDSGEDSKPVDDFLQEFDDVVDDAVRNGGIDADSYKACADILTGLARYGEEMASTQGSDAMGDMIKIGDLLNEVAEYFGYTQELTFASDSAKWLTNMVRGMLNEYEFPGNTVEGDNVKNYVVNRAVLFDNNVGFAFAHNPEAVSPFVTWRMFNDNGKLEYEWGNYFGSEEKALVDYISRATDYQRNEKVKEIPLPVPSESPEVKRLIQFIDSQYREQFKIPDGDSIRITYPLGDGREPVERECKFMGEMHTKIGSSIYHICEFASAMERISARFEPVNQLHNVEIMPYTAGVGEDKFFTYNREEGNTCAGSLHGDFGNNSDGDRFYANWKERDNGLFDCEIQSELQSVVYALRQDLLKDRASMLAYCQSHPEAKISEGKTSGDEAYGIYGFKLETESRQYFVNCFAQGRDSRFSVFAYADKPVPALEQSQQAQIDGRTDSMGNASSVTEKSNRTANNPKDKPSVLDEIRESRSAQKKPSKPKPEKTKAAQGKSTKKKNQTEL